MPGTTTQRTLSVDRVAMRFSAPFKISGYVFEAMPSILATIGEGGTTGRGEAAGVYYLGDGQDRMVDMVESIRDQVEQGVGRDELQSLLPPCGARNALDCALWELEARLTATPVWQLAGISEPKPRITAFTLPADDPAVIRGKLDELAFAKAVKLKLDGDLDADRERLAVVRSARPDVWLSVDANQGFSADDLDALEQMLRDHDVAMLEQPIKRGEEKALEGWRPYCPVAADESILDLQELEERGHLFDMINIKLDKCGGLTEALAIAERSRAMGKTLMVGNMGGSTLAMAPGFIIGQLCDVVDLDGPFGVADEPYVGEIYRDGEVFISERIWGAG